MHPRRPPVPLVAAGRAAVWGGLLGDGHLSPAGVRGPPLGPGRPAARGPGRGFEHVSLNTSRGCTHMTRHKDPIYRITTVCTRVQVPRPC